MERLSRREMLALIETIALATALPACKARRRDPRLDEPAPATGPKTALDATAFRALEAATARILPGGDGFAGAREARVTTFIDRQLAIAPYVRLAPAMVALAGALDHEAIARGKPAFAELEVAAQDQVLDDLARGALPAVKLPQRELFRVLHGLTIEGFLADPVHGGNQDGVGWKAIDFATPPLRTPGGHHGH